MEGGGERLVGVAWGGVWRGGGLSAVHPGGVNVLFCLGLERRVQDSSLARMLMRSAAQFGRIPLLRLLDLDAPSAAAQGRDPHRGGFTVPGF